MATISSLGSGSGIDLEGLISDIINAEASPVETRLNAKEADLLATISAFGTLNSSLAEFRTATQTLTAINAFKVRTAKSSDSELFTAVAENNAVATDYNIQVLNLAGTQKLSSGDFSSPDDIVGTGKLTISAGIQSFSVDITSGTLTEIADAINDSNQNFGAKASIISINDGLGGKVSKLVISAAESGTNNALTITVDDDDLVDEDGSGLSQLFYDAGNINSQLIEISEAVDAQITIDGFIVSNSTNTFSDAIEGVTITALSVTEDPENDLPAVLSIALDSAGVSKSVNSFVAFYNKLISTLDALSESNPEAGTQAALAGDFTIRSIGAQLRSILSSQFAGLDQGANSLVALGITTNADGKLEVNETKLSNAISTNLDDIEALFQSETGIASRIDNLINKYLQAGGILDAREDSLNRSLDDIADQRDALDLRLTALEDRYRQRFSALDSLISQLNSTSEFLISQLAITSSIISGKKSKND